MVDSSIQDQIIHIIKTYWGWFCKDGARRTILGYELAIDAGDSKPVCWKKPAYVPYEYKIVMDQVQKLLANGSIKQCHLPWGSIIVLAAKPHQKHVLQINGFIWRMCVSYWRLHAITKPFQYPIQQCDYAITFFAVGSSEMWIITLDARQGHH